MSQDRPAKSYDNYASQSDEKSLNTRFQGINFADESEATVPIGLMMLYKLYNRVTELEEYRDSALQREHQQQQLYQHLEQLTTEQDAEHQQRRQRQRQDDEKEFENERKRELEIFKKDLKTLEQRHVDDKIQSEKRWNAEKQLLESQLEQLRIENRRKQTEHKEELAETSENGAERRRQMEDEWESRKQMMEEQWQRQTHQQQQQRQIREKEIKQEIEGLKEKYFKNTQDNQHEIQRLQQMLFDEDDMHRKEQEQWLKRNEDLKMPSKTYDCRRGQHKE